MIRIAVLVSGGGTNLQALLDAEKDDRLRPGKIALVLSSRADVYALKRAEKADVPRMVLSPNNYADNTAYSAALAQTLQENKIDLVVLAGFLTILGPPMLEAFPRRILNVHPSLLPAFGGDGFYGLRVHQAALDRGVKITGATVHFVNDVTDGGEIILQKAVKVKKGDTSQTLQKRVMEQAEWAILPKAVHKICRKLS